MGQFSAQIWLLIEVNRLTKQKHKSLNVNLSQSVSISIKKMKMKTMASE